jgi:hypothetical protein
MRGLSSKATSASSSNPAATRTGMSSVRAEFILHVAGFATTRTTSVKPEWNQIRKTLISSISRSSSISNFPAVALLAERLRAKRPPACRQCRYRSGNFYSPADRPKWQRKKELRAAIASGGEWRGIHSAGRGNSCRQPPLHHCRDLALAQQPQRLQRLTHDFPLLE